MTSKLQAMRASFQLSDKRLVIPSPRAFVSSPNPSASAAVGVLALDAGPGPSTAGSVGGTRMATSMDDGLRYSFTVWFGDEHTTILWSADMNAGRNTTPPSWAHFVEESIVDAFSLPRGSRLVLSYTDRDGQQAQLARDTPYLQFWDSLPRTSQHQSTGKHGRLDVRRVEVERAEPAMCQIALGSRTRLFWCSLDDGAWDDIQLGVSQAFGLAKGSRVVFSVIDDEDDEITICDSFSWKLLLSILAIAPQSPKPVRIYITSVNGSAASPLESDSTTGGPPTPIGDPRTLIPLPYLGATKVRFFVGQTRANFWFRNVHSDPDAWLVNWKVLWARASTMLGRPTGGSAAAVPEMFTFDHRGRLVTLTTAVCWKTYASILNTYEKPFNKIEMHIKPAGASAIAPPTAPPAAGQKGSRFQIRAVGLDVPVLCFVHRQALHIAVWTSRPNETPAGEWTRAQAHVRELFHVPALEPYTLSYVDADHGSTVINTAESWQIFVAFAKHDVNKIRIVSLAQQGEAVTATTRPPAPAAEVPRVASPPPGQSTNGSAFAMRRAVRVSIVGSAKSIGFDPPPAYPLGMSPSHGAHTQKMPLVQPQFMTAPLPTVPPVPAFPSNVAPHPPVPVRATPPVRSPPPIPLPNPPSTPLPPVPTQFPPQPPIIVTTLPPSRMGSPSPLSATASIAPSLPPIAPVSPIATTSAAGAAAATNTLPPRFNGKAPVSAVTSDATQVAALQRELAEAKEEIARLREARDRSQQTILHLSGEVSRLVQENLALQKEREAGL